MDPEPDMDSEPDLDPNIANFKCFKLKNVSYNINQNNFLKNFENLPLLSFCEANF